MADLATVPGRRADSAGARSDGAQSGVAALVARRLRRRPR
jgi:hypothetical protein